MLTAKHLADAIAVLKEVADLRVHLRSDEEAVQIGRLNARAAIAAIALEVYGGLNDVKIEVKQDD